MFVINKKKTAVFCPIEILNCEILPTTTTEAKCKVVLLNLSDRTVSKVRFKIKGQNNLIVLKDINMKEADKAEFILDLPSNIEQDDISVSVVDYKNGRVWKRSTSVLNLNIKRAILFIIALVIIASAYYVAVSHLIPNYNLSKSVQLLSDGKFDKARSILNEIKNYSNSSNYLKAIEGNFVDQDKIIYYLDQSYNNTLYYLELKTGYPKKIVNSSCKSFDLINKTIYYNNAVDDSIHSVSIDGTNSKKLTDKNTVFITADDYNFYYYSPTDGTIFFNSLKNVSHGVVKDNKYITCNDKNIFYVKPDDNNGIYSLSKDGMTRQLICNAPSVWLNADENYVYYANTFQTNNIYRVDLETKKQEILRDNDCSYVKLLDNWVYFINNTSSARICRIKSDGSQFQQITKDSASEIVLKGKTIYFVNVSDNKRLYSINVSGEKQVKLNDTTTSELYLEGDLLHFTNLSDNDKLEKIQISN